MKWGHFLQSFSAEIYNMEKVYETNMSTLEKIWEHLLSHIKGHCMMCCLVKVTTEKKCVQQCLGAHSGLTTPFTVFWLPRCFKVLMP